MAELNKNKELSMADVIVGQATSVPTADMSRRKTRGIMGAKQEEIRYSPMDPEASLPDFVRDHLNAIRELRTPEDTETPGLDFFQGQDIDATVDTAIMQDARKKDSLGAKSDYGDRTGGSVVEDPSGLMGLLTKHEGKDFNTIFNGSPIQPPKPITQMTVGELRAFQDSMVDAGSESSAVGKNQIIRGTMDQLIKDGAISKDDVFNTETQTRAFNHLVEKRGLSTFKDAMGSAKSEAEKIKAAQRFQLNLAKEFASIPVPYDIPSRNLKKGDSYHKGVGSNASLFGADDFLSLLLKQGL